MLKPSLGWLALLATGAVLSTVGCFPVVPAHAAQCEGDCDGNGSITVDELVHGVSIALEEATLASCPSFDVDGDGLVTVDELVGAVDRSLHDCALPPQPTATSTAATALPTASASAVPSGSTTPTPTPPNTFTPIAVVTVTPTAAQTASPSASIYTPTPTPSCAPTGTPYCARTCDCEGGTNCFPCPTVRPDPPYCLAVPCGLCLSEACLEGLVRSDCAPEGQRCSCACVTPTPAPVCTPPLCSGDEVLHCPDQCPGGCGVQCATTTPTPTVSASPTFTVTCAPTGTPYSSERCTPCPTVRADCPAIPCGPCIEYSPTPTPVPCDQFGPDPSFGVDGAVSLAAYEDFGQALLVDADGKIVVGGYSRNDPPPTPTTTGTTATATPVGAFTGADFAVARIDQDGSPDASFGTNGWALSPLPGEQQAFALVRQPDGKLVLAGHTCVLRCDAALARYLSDGNPDTQFGVGGMVTTAIGDEASLQALSLQGDEIVAAGSVRRGDHYAFVVARYHSDGSPDASFDGDGLVETPIRTDAWARAVLLQSDDRLVVAGYACDNRCSFAIARYMSEGSLDPSFGGSGVVVTPITTSGPIGLAGYAFAAALQDDGRIVVVGTNDSDVVLARYLPSGALDGAFGDAGIAIHSFSDGYDAAYAVALGTDGKISIAGYAAPFNPAPGGFMVARFLSDGSRDGSFAPDGKIVRPGGTAHGLAIDPSGRLVAAGGKNVLRFARRVCPTP